jgi:glycosyltransferase involved in cell wall biosynthesis
MVRISVVTPSVRPEGLDIVKRSLDKQTFRDFEWIVVAPFWDKPETLPSGIRTCSVTEIIKLPDPPRNKDDNYGLNKAWNAAFKVAKGELIISFVDMTWIPPDALQNFWYHYQDNPKSLVGGVGNQYAEVQNGKPEIMIWKDPRMRMDQGSFYEINPIDLEFCLTSVPKQAIFDIGGWDEAWDKYAALSEKEACLRMDKLGYKFYLDQSIEYRALTHPRLTKDWEERYRAGCKYMEKCIHEINEGIRLKLNYVVDKSSKV